MHRLGEPAGKVRCLACGTADCVIATPTAQGPRYRCYRCGPVVRCRFPTAVPLPECYIRCYDERTERREEEPSEDEPELDRDANELRVAPHGCVICRGEIWFRFYTYYKQFAEHALCDRCGIVVLVTDDPDEPKFRPIRQPRMQLLRGRHD